MPPKTRTHPPDQDDVPGFAQAEIPEGEPPDLHDLLGDEYVRESPQGSAAPSMTSPPPSPPAPAPGSTRARTSSTPESPSEDDDELEDDVELSDGLEFLAGGLFELAGQVLNRFARVRRRGQPTSLWLVTDEEAEAFAAPIGRIAERHLPDELRSGDSRDVVIAGSVAIEYAAHNAAGIPGLEHEAPLPPPPPAPASAPPPPAPATSQHPPAGTPTTVVDSAGGGAQPSAVAEPEPLIPPNL